MRSTLSGIQAFFARAVQQPLGAADQPETARRAHEVAAGNERLSPVDQLEIYREQFWLRHLDALEEDFVTVSRLVGHEEFHRLVERYLAAHPSAAFSLRDLGVDFASFVAHQSPYSRDPLLADAARLEWAFVEAFDAADAAPVAPETIAAIPEDAWPGVRFTFHPALHRLAVGYPVHVYRAAVRAGESPARPEASPVKLAVYRGPETLQYIEVEPLAFDLLERLATGEPLGAACESVAAGASTPDAEAELEAAVGRWFQFWTTAGWVTDVSYR